MMKARSMAPLLALAAAALGCCEAGLVMPAEGPPLPPLSSQMSPEAIEIALHYEEVIDLVESMVQDRKLQEAARQRRLSIVNVMWEDAGRAQGSALGPNISDLTLQVRRRDPWGRYADALMPVLRYPNFTDRTGDVPASRFFLRVGNERGSELRTVALSEVLKDMRSFASSPDTLAGPEGSEASALDLSAPRDTHYLVSAQAVFLPIPKAGKAEFNPVLFNYQSSPSSPAVLSILATREGTSVAVIENRTEDKTYRGSGQELYFNDGGKRAAFTAERRSDVAARIKAQGGPRTEADRSALGKGADVLALIQVPLKHKNEGVLGGFSPPSGGGGDGYGYEFSDEPLNAGGFGPNDAMIRVRPGPVRMSVGGDVERAVLGHGPHLGPFLEGTGSRLVRDPSLPIRITVQFYKATSDGIASEADLDAIAKSIGSVYEHAEYVGSLVVPEGDQRRPTEWQTIPNEWFPW